MRIRPFEMERWQSRYEHRVRYNLSESGVRPLTTRELLDLAGVGAERLLDLPQGYAQSNGSDLLRERAAALYPDTSPESILVTVGGAEANFAAAWHFAEPGSSAAVLVPTYMQLPRLLEGFGVEVRRIPLVEEQGWQPDLDRLASALEGGARLVVVTNPNNPTGAVLTRSSRKRLVELCDRYGAWILSDEVYRGAEVEGPVTPSLLGEYERVVATHSLSKAYGLPGARLGWLVGPEPLVDDLWSRTDYTTIAPATLSERLATLALEPETLARIRARTRAIVTENLAAVAAWLDARAELFSYCPPSAGAIALLRYAPGIDSTELAERLRVEEDVLIVPGAHFGLEGMIRIGFGIPWEEVREGMDRLERTCRKAVPGNVAGPS